MRVLVACEESQRVCKEFRRRGHEAYSCDLLPCGGASRVAHPSGRARNSKNGVGHGPGVSSVYASRGIRRGMVQREAEEREATDGHRVLPRLYRSGSRSDGGNREPYRDNEQALQKAGPDNTAVAIWGQLLKIDLSMVEGAAKPAAGSNRTARAGMVRVGRQQNREEETTAEMVRRCVETTSERAVHGKEQNIPRNS